MVGFELALSFLIGYLLENEKMPHKIYWGVNAFFVLIKIKIKKDTVKILKWSSFFCSSCGSEDV